MSSLSGRTPPRLMIVDDNVRLASVSARMLSTHGYDAVAFSDPHEALSALEGPHDFDVVVTDLSMPGMSGEDFVLAIRERCPQLPVIISTGLPEALQDSDKSRLGIQEVLRKPWSMDEAVNAIERVLLARGRAPG